MNNLLPCPFCGGQPRLFKQNIPCDSQETWNHRLLHWYICDTYACGVALTHGEWTEERAREKWNTRHNLGAVSKKWNRPSLEEVKLQCAKVGLPAIEAEAFWNYYESNGWKVGKNPMKSWPSALANWSKNWRERNAKTNERPRNFGPDRNKGTYGEQRLARQRELAAKMAGPG